VNPRCYYCGVKFDDGKHRLTWDHKIPRSRGGKGKHGNLVPACFTCNQEKGVLTENEYKLVLYYRKTEAERVSLSLPPTRIDGVFLALTLEDYAFLYDVGTGY
jgi:5-methylcytosine-specific restriction endonuclease McrA